MCLKTTNHLVSNLYINKTRLKVAKCFDDVQSFIFDVKFGDFRIYLGGWLDLGLKVEFSVLSAPPAALKTTKHVRARKTAFWTFSIALSLWENDAVWDAKSASFRIWVKSYFISFVWMISYAGVWSRTLFFLFLMLLLFSVKSVVELSLRYLGAVLNQSDHLRFGGVKPEF